MSCKTAFRAEVAQSCMGRSVGHKKASRVVKHREAMVAGVLYLFRLVKFTHWRINLLASFFKPLA
jgi:hypothetical protein